MIRHLVVFCLTGTFTLFVGCSEEAPKQAPVPVAAPAKPRAPSIPSVKMPAAVETPKDTYFYNPAGKRDPFASVETDFALKDTGQPRAPLERFALADMALTGIIWGIADPRALIRTPDGLSYIIRANARIGKNKGRVSRITRKEVYIEEEYRDPTGKLMIRESSFQIRKSGVEQTPDKMQLRVKDEVES